MRLPLEPRKYWAGEELDLLGAGIQLNPSRDFQSRGSPPPTEENRPGSERKEGDYVGGRG